MIFEDGKRIQGIYLENNINIILIEISEKLFPKYKDSNILQKEKDCNVRRSKMWF